MSARLLLINSSDATLGCLEENILNLWFVSGHGKNLPGLGDGKAVPNNLRRMSSHCMYFVHTYSINDLILARDAFSLRMRRRPGAVGDRELGRGVVFMNGCH